MVLGEESELTPTEMDALLDAHCGNDFTIMFVSACFSGIFASEELQAPNRFIMTAARSDRSSFGCGEGDDFPYFDRCVVDNVRDGVITLAEGLRVAHYPDLVRQACSEMLLEE